MSCEAIQKLHRYAKQTGLRGARSVINTNKGQDRQAHVIASVQQEIINGAEKIICDGCPLNSICDIRLSQIGGSVFTKRNYGVPHGNELRR